MPSIVISVGMYNVYTLLWLQEVGILDKGGDILLTVTSEEERERVAALSRFGNVYIPSDVFHGVDTNTYLGTVSNVIGNQKRYYHHKMEQIRYLKPKYAFRDASKDYDHLLFDTPLAVHPFSLWLYDDLYNGRAIKLSTWEHGLSSYFPDKGRDLSRINNFGMLMDLYNVPYPREKMGDIYLFQPELAAPCIPSSRLVKVPAIDVNNNEYKAMVNRLYRFSSSVLSEIGEYIFLDQNVGGADVFLSPVTEMIRLVNRVVGKNKLAVKLHPWNIGNPYQDVHTIGGGDKSISWEVLCMNMPQLDDKVIITVHSMGAFTPKLNFDAEPYIIFLFRLLENYKHSNIDTLFERLASVYRQPKKVFAPNTYAELENVLKTVKGLQGSPSKSVSRV